jgi:hypothetical protein
MLFSGTIWETFDHFFSRILSGNKSRVSRRLKFGYSTFTIHTKLTYPPLCNILIFEKLFANLIMKASKQKPPFKEFTFFSSKEDLPPYEIKIAKSVWKKMKYLPAYV